MCLFNEVITVLEKLARHRSSVSSKVYMVVVEVYGQVQSHDDKVAYVLNNFRTILEEHPKIPSYMMLELCKDPELQPHTFALFRLAISTAESVDNLVRIGTTLLKVFLQSVLVNCTVGPLLYEIVKKTVDDELGQAFMVQIVK